MVTETLMVKPVPIVKAGLFRGHIVCWVSVGVCTPRGERLTPDQHGDSCSLSYQHILPVSSKVMRCQPSLPVLTGQSLLHEVCLLRSLPYEIRAQCM